MSTEFNRTYTKSDLMRKKVGAILLPIVAFILTFISTTIAGVMWTTNFSGGIELAELANGLPYSISIILVMGFHEFGHYFASLAHRVKASLPYFIPFPPLPGFINFGTMGAVIRTKAPIKTRRALLDVGAAGPIAGFVVSVVLLVYGFLTLPGVEYILAIHPDYFSPEYSKGAISLIFGDSILFSGLRSLLTTPDQFVPPMSEIYHYPYLCAGWFGLFITSMNLLPVGQLDGGHILCAIAGNRKHLAVASVTMIALIIIGVLGVVSSFYPLPFDLGWSGWLFWALLLKFVIKVEHPPVSEFEELGWGRKLIGYVTMVIFIISFTHAPFILSFQ